ncbi:beta/gamma crystallin domain-containing protein 1 [Cololabis saira]|uniref:beta/gamma crystallin domain-containing protein 1 n=1 Tax=Cololabis saira TaxID=129043 RepID=UPI002AD43C9F|nr:beta/gamma crystallin domain-containing protein 1 [Cololabis saira]
MSDCPEEQPSTGVLGRIGNWFSPWRGTAPKAPGENASSSNDCYQGTGGDEEREDSVRIQEQQWQEENPSSVRLFRDIFPREEDATQSAHRDSSPVSSAETREGAPREEELVVCREQKTGQGDGREESSGNLSASGNPDKNVSDLTHLCSPSEQGGVRDFDQGPAHPHAQTRQTGKRLHVYLEETSVIHCGEGTSPGREVVSTTLKKSLKVLHKANSSHTINVTASPGPAGVEKNVRPTVGEQSYSSTSVGASLKPHKDSQFEFELDKEQTEAGDMGRKNASKRRQRKNSQEEGGNSPHGEKKPPSANSGEGISPTIDSVASPQGKSPNASTREVSVDSSLKRDPTPQASPAGAEGKNSCPDKVKQLGNLQNSNSVTAASRACEVDEGADMEQNEGLYTVERKTETPGSKRRSIKVSQSEVKLFRKNVPLDQNESEATDHQDFYAELKNKPEDAKNEPTTEPDARPHDPKKAADGSKVTFGRIADKISLFQQLDGGHSKAFQTPRSADGSPIRKVTERVKADFLLSEQRSRSAERCSTTRSSSSSPAKDHPMTIKERARQFLASQLDAKPRTSQMPGTSQKSTSAVVVPASKPSELDNRDKLDTGEQMRTKTKSGITSKPDGQDTSAVGVQISASETQLTGSKTKGKEVSTAADKTAKPHSVETAKDPGDSVELSNATSPHSEGPSRTGSRSKKRKGKETSSPVSPNTQNKPVIQDQVDDVRKTFSVSKQLPDKASLPSSKDPGDTSHKPNDPKLNALNKKSEVSDTQKKVLDTLLKTNNVEELPRTQDGLPEASINNVEPDTAARSRGTKKTVDKAAVLPGKEEKSEKHSLAITSEREKASEGRSETSASSPSSAVSVQQSIEKSPPENVEKLKMAGKEKTNYIEKKDEGKSLSSKSTTNNSASNREQVISGNEGGVEEAKQAEIVCQLAEKAAASSHLPFQTQPASQIVNSSEGHKEHQKVGKTANVPPESQRRPTESSGKEREALLTAAEPQPGSASVEKTGNSLDDSCAHGAIVELSNLEKPVPASERLSSKDAALVLTDFTLKAQKESSSEAAPLRRDRTSASAEVGQEDTGKKSPAAKSVHPKGKISGELLKPALSQTRSEEIKTTKSTGNILSVEDSEINPQSPSGSKVREVGKTSETSSLAVKQLSPIANGDNASDSQVFSVRKGLISGKTSQSSKAPEDNLIPSTSATSTMNKLHLPQRLSKDDSLKHQDAPSSWLDVDLPKHKFKVQEAKLTSFGSENNLLDTSGELDDDDFVARVTKLCAPFSLPPRKHTLLRPPQPPFVMPAIREDRHEKTFDPEEFTFGLRKKSQFTLDTTSGILAKRHSTETKSGLVARASVADRSLLLSGLKDKNPNKEAEDVKEEKDDQSKVKSRLERSGILNSLTSSYFSSKRNNVQTEGDSPGSENVWSHSAQQLSPLLSPQTAPPSETAVNKEPVAEWSAEEAQAAETVVSDSVPPLPSFNDIKLPEYLEKYLPRDPALPVQSTQGQEQIKPEFTLQFDGEMATLAPGVKADLVKPSLLPPDVVTPRFPGIPAATQAALPDLKQPPIPPRETLRHTVTTVKGFHKRPGKMVLFEKAQFNGQAYETYRDVADASSLQLSPLISVKVVRGCWVLYEKPDFQGRTIALEEGATELENMWAETGPETNPANSSPMIIGSIRLVVMDYSIPRIDLFSEPEGHGRVTPYHDDTIETGSFGVPLNTASIQVHSGVWLLFSDPGFQGMVSVLETGVYPFPETWGFPSPFVGSLRPLKMGGFKVENSNDVEAQLYERPGFEGSCVQIDSEVFRFCEGVEGIDADGENADAKKLKSVASLRITGGLWVGYSQPGFEGQQYILEEGEYLDCSDWGGSELLSLRPVLSDFLSPHVKLFSDRDFDKLGVNIDLRVPVINMDDTGYGMKTQSAEVISGVWVMFEEPGFCGESYVLERGLYGSPEDWGALQHRACSMMPVLVDDLENSSKFKVQLFSDPGLQGSALILEDSVTSLDDGFSVASCKVLAGSWLAFEGRDFTGKMYVLEVGSYPDLRAMGCVSGSSSIQSLQTVGFEFSLPSITLFERCDLRGKRVLLTDGSVNLQLAGGCGRVQSVLVEGGVWILYKEINYRGAQILLKPGEVSDWHEFSSWKKIGSLRPLLQKQVHFRLRNRQTGLIMSVTGDLDDVKLMRIQETEETGGVEQIWYYRNGFLHCKLLEECCLSRSGSITIAGSRVGLTPEASEEIHLWSITPEGFVRYTLTADLVLEIKGGHHYDKNQVILNTLDPNKLQQRWDVEII